MAQNQNQASVKTLQDSPLFQLSLTSKELFHSNFLYWLGVTYRDLFKETFSNLGCRTAAWPEDLDGGKGVQGCQIDQSGSLCEGTGEKWKNIPDSRKQGEEYSESTAVE